MHLSLTGGPVAPVGRRTDPPEDAVVDRPDASTGRAPGAPFAWTPGRVVGVALSSPALFVVLTGVSGATPGLPVRQAFVALLAVASAATLATYLPAPKAGFRLAVGCAPCAWAAALSVPVAAAVLSGMPPDVPSAALALVVATVGLLQRLTQPRACAI